MGRLIFLVKKILDLRCLNSRLCPFSVNWKNILKIFSPTIGGIKNSRTFAPALSERGTEKGNLKFGAAGFESRFREGFGMDLVLKKIFKKS